MLLTFKDIQAATNGTIIMCTHDEWVKGISTDSRKAKEYDLFIPLLGERFNGHDYIKDAMDKGIKTLLVSQLNDTIQSLQNVNVILVQDTLKALQDLSKFNISQYHIPKIGVTGSTGKTSTKDLIYSVLKQKYNVLRNEGNFNNHIGLPLTVNLLDSAHEAVVLEMGMSHPGEIDVLADIVRPNIAIITNIGLSHIENLKTQENILKAKMEITNYFKEDHVLIVNGDDRLLKQTLDSKPHYTKYLVGIGEPNHYRAIHIKDLGLSGITFDVVIENQEIPFKLRVPGYHNIYNALLAIAVGILMNIDIDLIQEGVWQFKGSKMRLNVTMSNDHIKIIDDAYNASPDSMRAALAVLNNIDAHRKIAILGDMLEMGEYAEEGHYNVGEEVFEKAIDILITVGKNAEFIAKGAMDRGLSSKNIFICKNNKEAIDQLCRLLRAGDAILIKGSRGMKMEEIVEYVQERS